MCVERLEGGARERGTITCLRPEMPFGNPRQVGPIGLEAALWRAPATVLYGLRTRPRGGSPVTRWGHVRLFSPFGMNSTPLGRAAALKQKPSLEMPGNDVRLTRLRARPGLPSTHR